MATSNSTNNLITREEAAEYLGISVRTLDTLRAQGKIPFKRLPSVGDGGRGPVRFDRKALDETITPRLAGRRLGGAR